MFSLLNPHTLWSNFVLILLIKLVPAKNEEFSYPPNSSPPHEPPHVCALNECPAIPDPIPDAPHNPWTFDPASLQLETWAASHSQASAGFVRDPHGTPVPSLTATLAIGQHGPAMMQDAFLLNKIRDFNREKIQERVVHAKGHGAFGYFQVTHDISNLTKADFLNGIGKKTPLLVRFSVVAGESGSTDLVRDAIGMAIKFYTVDGNFDLLCCGMIPVFPIRDAMLFKDLNKSRKRNPQTHLPDPNMFWDFASLRLETILHTVNLFSDFPANSRVTSSFGVNAFKLVNHQGHPVYVKFHFISQQPFTWYNSTELALVSGMDPDHNTRDLYDAISNKNFPKWKLYIQMMTLEEASVYPTDPFDPTKVWRPEQFPLMEVGELVLNENPKNYFDDIEQAAFCPARMPPGIEPSPDKMFQARLAVYPDAQRYRLGTNFPQIDVNQPKLQVSNYVRDGFMKANPNGAGSPNYFPNSFHGPLPNQSALASVYHVKGLVDRHDNEDDVEDNFRLARLYVYKDLTKNQRSRVAQNLGGSLAKAVKFLRDRAIKDMFYRISEEFGKEVFEQTELALAAMKK